LITAARPTYDSAMNNVFQATPQRLVPRLHEEPSGIPYFDEELGVPQNTAHRIMVSDAATILASIAKEADLAFLSDEPIWYLHPESDVQRTFYGDCVLARKTDTRTIIADSVLLAIEVVSTQDRRKELKDTRFQRLLNEYNGVAEFALLFPDLGDARALTWCQLVAGQYEEHIVAPGGRVSSQAVPGLELRVVPLADWTPGYKIEVFYRGEHRPRLLGERARAEQARTEAEQARTEAEQARTEAEHARTEAEHARTEAEHARTEAEHARTEAIQERERAERLAARLRELGVEP